MSYRVKYKRGQERWTLAVAENLNGVYNRFEDAKLAYESAKVFRQNYNTFDISVQDDEGKIIWESPMGILRPFSDSSQQRKRRFRVLR